jgi:PknH-like extracellular domain
MRIPAIATVSAGMVLAACTTTVAGVAVDASDPPTVSRPLHRLLPTSAELSTALGIGPDGFMGQLVEGGADTLLQGIDQSEAAPVECVSAAYRLQKMVYAASPVRSDASRSWAGGDPNGPSFSAFFGVVQLASAGDARAFFAATADEWRQCDGQTMALHQAEHGTHALTRITDVAVDDRIVSAVLMHDPGRTVERALGVASDCIVDVEVSDLGGSSRTGNAGGAVDVAILMLKKITGS